MYSITKRSLDILVSSIILILFIPLFLIVAICIKIDSPGPVFFRQERLGKAKELFTIYKFRTMHANTPKNIPTAKLHEPKRHITRVGKILRKTSIDELPQLFNILKGDMSIVGPRPVILTEEDLIAERELVGAYDVLPGVTGLAQINGRDEVGVFEKARLDGEYVEKQTLFFDLKIFISTLAYVLKMDGIVEGVMSLPDGHLHYQKQQKRILMLGNSEIVIYNFRLELVERLLENGHEVVISSPPGEKIDKLVEMGCIHEPVEMDRRGINPVSDMRLLRHYHQLMKRIKPDMVFGYTVKPNIFGSLAARRYNIPFVTNVTGLGSAVERPGLLRRIVVLLYKWSLANVQTVFFQNKRNRQFFEDNQIAVGRHELVPGSGVNLRYYSLLEYPSTDESIDFVLISRIMKEKGIDEYLEAAEYMKKKYPHTRFHIAGFFEESYEEVINEYVKKGIVIYHGMLQDVRELLVKTHCTVLPSYHEGMSNVLLESAACGRPVLASNIEGCKETFDEGVSGYGFEPRNPKKLIKSMEEFIKLPYDKMKKMGLAGRRKMEIKFDREKVVETYMEEIDKVMEKVVEVQR
jgi:lipopolysaccharide/colanic/teichoic acid biosynthesis glycosyltransferase/glycosyltransferase involved in cell wall biosynthesis